MSISNKAAKRILISWGLFSTLGFYRGVMDDNYNYEQKMKKKDTIYIQSHPKLYCRAFGKGCLGVLFYTNPVLWVILIPKELYRLEVVLRGLEKKSDYYELV